VSLRRTQPIQRRSRLERGSRPRRISKRLAGWRSWIDQERSAVQERRLCDVGGCTKLGTDWHHPFGRSPEPWASSRLVTAWVCRDHHRRITGEVGSGLAVDLRDALRAAAVYALRAHVERIRSERGTRHTLTWVDEDGESLPSLFRFTISVAEANGIAPPHFDENHHHSGGDKR
jgi:hypothetical protein